MALRVSFSPMVRLVVPYGLRLDAKAKLGDAATPSHIRSGEDPGESAYLRYNQCQNNVRSGKTHTPLSSLRGAGPT